MRDAPLQPSAVNSPPLPQILAFPLNESCLLFSLYPRVLLLLLYPSSFKGEAKPLFYLQPCALMFLCFLPFFFGKACLFIIPQQACSSSSAFSVPLQRGVPHIQPLTMRAPPPLYVLIQGLGVPPLLPSAAQIHALTYFNHNLTLIQ